MISARFRLLLATGLLVILLGPAAAINPAQCGARQAAVEIAEAVDGHSLRLADGRVVRLVQILAPLPIDNDPAAAARARASLHEIAAGKSATLHLASDAPDRYGRLEAAAVLVEGKHWLEAVLLERGVARVLPSANDGCTAALLAVERKAREAQRGIWSDSRFRVFQAEELESLLAASGRFAVVEGSVRRVGRGRGRLYLDFGRRFTEDFTIIVPDRLRKILEAKGADAKNWRGRRIRARGILFFWGGPAMEIDLAQAIELLESPASE